MEYPVRINKFLALEGICSRREADALIADKRVKINGRLAVLGDKVFEGEQVEVVKGKKEDKRLAYLAFNKPEGIITHSPQQGEKSINDIVNFPQNVYPLGRLDKDSCGLIILTNDGRLTDKLLNPKYYHEKEYLVIVDKPINTAFLKQMGAGMVLDDGQKTRECKITRKGNFAFIIALTEGKKRQIRRMCEKLGYNVAGLKRMRIMNVRLESLKPGEFRKIKGEELRKFLASLGIRPAEKDSGKK